MQSLPQEKHTSFPVYLAPLIGRQREISDIHTLLLAGQCRLITLTGPGGIGKTTLATQAAAMLRTHFDHGVYFVPLQPVQDAHLIAAAIANAVGISFAGVEEPMVQVCRYLREKSALLVLDNFEHLLNGVSSVTTILEEAPDIKCLVTSREALNLREEWLYPVHGLDYPRRKLTDRVGSQHLEIQQYNAVQLFIERAKQLRHDLTLAEEGDAIVRICQLAEGMPLALELAATWTRSLRCAEIADQIALNLDFLSSRLRNVPHRHRTMQAVFDTSWTLLTEAEQAIFTRLCVFREGFTADAAQQICGASLATLTGLVDKSLLRWENNGRYRLHELLRQYAQAKLEQSPEVAAQVRDRHCAYYTDLLYQRRDEVIGKQKAAVIAAVEEEIDNVRAAWQWIIDTKKAEAIPQIMRVLIHFYQIRSRYREGADAYEQAVRAFDDGSPTRQAQIALIVLLVSLGWLYIRLGELARAKEVLQRCRSLYAELDLPPLSGYATDPDAALAIVCSIQGDFAEAVRLGRQSLQRNARHGHAINMQHAHYVLAGVRLKQGAYEEARHHAQRSLAIIQEMGDHWFMAICLIELGQIEEALGNYAVAEQHFRTSYTLREELGDPGGMAAALNYLGQVALRQQQPLHAQELYEQSRMMSADINDRGALATALEGLGAASMALDARQVAGQYHREALQLAFDIQFVPLIFSLFLHIGEWLLAVGKEARGLALLAMTRDHPTSPRSLRERAEELLAFYQASCAPELFDAAAQWHPAATLESVISALLLELAEPARLASGDSLPAQPPPPQQELIEPLTQREIEVLTLLAQGMTNQQIAQRMIVSIGTVKSHNHSIFAKLGVNNRTLAVARAREMKLL